MTVITSILAFSLAAQACTNLLVSRGASDNNATQLAYNADSGSLFGSIGYYPAKEHTDGAMREVWDWDSSKFLGKIPEAKRTYGVVGNVNEHGLIIGETTFGGLPQLGTEGTGAIMDYGSLIWIALQRSKTAREAIMLIDKLCTEYGYASEGESFSLADSEEVWLMELIGKGNYSRGAVWVARKIPEGYVGGTANQARIRTFPLNDPENCLYAKDVVSFAKSIGLYPEQGKDEDFSFSDTYDPVSFTGARLAEARMWTLFNKLSDGGMAEYLDYAQGFNLTNRMPLFVKPSSPLSLNDTMELMRSHGEETWFDPRGVARSDVGAGPGHSPYRWRPLTWSQGSKSYVNERTVGTQQTAWSFVASSRAWMPAPLRAIMWFAPDDSSTGVRIPVFGGSTLLPKSFADRVGQEPGAAVSYGVEADAGRMSLDSAFWIYNLVANMAYGDRYAEVYPVIHEKVIKFQQILMEKASEVERKAAELYKEEPGAAVKLLSEFVAETGDSVTREWREFWMYLFARFRDGFTVEAPELPQCKGDQKKACTSRSIPNVKQTGYQADWYARVVSDGDNEKHYGIPTKYDSNKIKAIEKL